MQKAVRDKAVPSPTKQHLIDPEICIRCNTCEETCPQGAVTHNDDNYVVIADKCDYCMDCISPCPTGAIDNWRVVAAPYPIESQFEWDELPQQESIASAGGAASSGAVEAFDDEIIKMLEEAHQGLGGRSVAPRSASKPSINLFSRSKPATARVQGNFRLTREGTETDVRHIILDIGNQAFPVVEGQSVGIVPPGLDANGKPEKVRLYSIACPRDGEKPNANNIALTVKRETDGRCSNYICDLAKGDEVELTGPYGATFLMPDDPTANIIMICTGTGSAPFRGFTMRRQRTAPQAEGHLALYFGARTPEELPYFGPLKRIPKSVMTQRLVFSRIKGEPKRYVQDQMRQDADWLSSYIANERTYIYVCGLKGMEEGVEAALAEICEGAGLDWETQRALMRQEGRLHLETY